MEVYSYSSLSTNLSDTYAANSLALASLEKTVSRGLNSASETTDSGSADSGDTVSISEEAMALAAQSAAGSNASTTISGSFTIDSGVLTMTGSNRAMGSSEIDSSSDMASASQTKLWKQIKNYQDQIRAVQDDSTLTDNEKQAKVQQLETQLLMAQSQLAEAESGGVSTRGDSVFGTSAISMVGSLT